MTPLVRALAAALLAALVLAWSPAHAAPADLADPADAASARAETDQVVFTGTFVRVPRVDFEGSVPVRRYQVEVQQVFGAGTITTQRITVRSRVALESCRMRQSGLGQAQAEQGGASPNQTPGATQTDGAQQSGNLTPDPTTEPTTDPTTDPATPSAPESTDVPPTIDKRLRAFVSTVDGSEYVVTSCLDVGIADAAVLAAVADKYGEGHVPGSPETPVTPLDDVGYLCPDTSDTVDIDDPATCDALDESQSFDRAAAPGLALVIVGVLGLLVVRRLGRRT